MARHLYIINKANEAHANNMKCVYLPVNNLLEEGR